MILAGNIFPVRQAREDGRRLPELPLDEELAPSYGAYASFATPNAPVHTEFHGDPPALEFDRLLDRFVTPETDVLDLGCGAGFTLCKIAAGAKSVLGVDLDARLIEAAKLRAADRGLHNVSFILGDTVHSATVGQIPDGAFSLALSRRGPFLTPALVEKLTPDGLFLVELAQDFLGLKKVFGRTPFLPSSPGDPEPTITYHAGSGLVPVSAKSYWYEEYFTDADHLGRYLSQGAPLQNWWMEACVFDEDRDRAALELYARFNTTPHGIRLVGHRRIYLFRRQRTNYYPVVGE